MVIYTRKIIFNQFLMLHVVKKCLPFYANSCLETHYQERKYKYFLFILYAITHMFFIECDYRLWASRVLNIVSNACVNCLDVSAYFTNKETKTKINKYFAETKDLINDLSGRWNSSPLVLDLGSSQCWLTYVFIFHPLVWSRCCTVTFS